ncbi:MAG: tetratricopeptide repeat protein [Deltaproteobacteria bacterium]|nr:tetratricopeptide repeat protein [Deltaproteobacteria bacterium]
MTSLGKRLEAYDHVQRGKKQFEEKDLQGSVQEFKRALSLNPEKTPGDRALFYLGLLYAHYDNPGRNYGKSLFYFQKLIRDFPESGLNERSKIWIKVLKDLEEKQHEPVKSIIIRSQEKSVENNKTQEKSIANKGKKLLDMGNFKEAIEESRQVLSQFPNTPPGDEALFTIALIFADYRNPNKDYIKSLLYFKRLINEFPHSTLREQAKTWIEVLDVIEKAKQVDIEIEEKRKEVTR